MVRYPGLYYIFPVFTHDHDGTTTTFSGVTVNHHQIQQSASDTTVVNNEEYVQSTYVNDVNGTSGDNYQYVPVSGTEGDLTEEDNFGLSDVIFYPRQLSVGGATFPATTGATTAAWQLPYEDYNASAGQRQPNVAYVIDATSSENQPALELPFMDHGYYDGRELMGSRLLDIDLSLLTTNEVGTSGDHWIPDDEGIVYAFREDAKREDGIVRPKNTSCTVNDSVIDCMSADPADYTDPDIETVATKVSVKPVDFFPDPDRRPYGFALTRGRNIAGNCGSSAENSCRNTVDRTGDDDGLYWGMTFVTDNMVYIKGDFNWHTTDPDTLNSNDIIEEFDDTTIIGTTYDFDDFYDRTSLDARFADPEQDFWRPVEILADAVGVLANENTTNRPFYGYVEDMFSTAGDNNFDGPANETNLSWATNTGERAAADIRFRHGDNTVGHVDNTSYMNSIRPAGTSNNAQNKKAFDGNTNAYWLRGDNGKGFADTLPFFTVPFVQPVKLNRNGVPMYCADDVDPCTTPLEYTSFFREAFVTGSGSLNNAQIRYQDLDKADAETTVFATIVSGIIPQRNGQPYGGFHNFPRMLQGWTGANLNFIGGFFQLNFSTSATGLFDQEADTWDPDGSKADAPPTGASARFYSAPTRNWGYDVGLQLAPAGPVADRFVTLSSARGEFYKELPVDDPYISLLRCAPNPFDGDNPVDPRVTQDGTACPT